MAREAKNPNEGKKATLVSKDGKITIDMSALRGKSANDGVSEQQSYMDDLYERVQKREAEKAALRAERIANGEEVDEDE